MITNFAYLKKNYQSEAIFSNHVFLLIRSFEKIVSSYSSAWKSFYSIVNVQWTVLIEFRPNKFWTGKAVVDSIKQNKIVDAIFWGIFHNWSMRLNIYKRWKIKAQNDWPVVRLLFQLLLYSISVIFIWSNSCHIYELKPAIILCWWVGAQLLHIVLYLYMHS